MIGAARNEFMLIQVAKVNTDCNKLLRQEKFFRVWYHPSGVLRKKPRDETEGLKYVEIIPEPKCKYTTGKKAVNRSAAFVHFTMLRMRLP
ncbi:unnamed protein product, partial [Onchocerca ochengi]|uniref:Uncharacterized protein n=1 Tax=Onchocerca ochengi TaxID=42157 RepID=A0A182EU58_ONCOC